MNAQEITSKSGLALPCKCKLCGKVIGHYSLEWPPPKDNAAQQSLNEQQIGILCGAMGAHVNEAARRGMREHAGALAAAMSSGGNMTMLMVAKMFDLPEGAKGFFENSRQAIHEMSRAFRMTDSDIEYLATVAMCNSGLIETGPVRNDGLARDYPELASTARAAIVDMLRSLRDRYEAGSGEQKPAPGPKLVV